MKKKIQWLIIGIMGCMSIALHTPLKKVEILLELAYIAPIHYGGYVISLNL